MAFLPFYFFTFKWLFYLFMLQRYEKYQCETILSPDYFQKVLNVKIRAGNRVPRRWKSRGEALKIAKKSSGNHVEKQRKSREKVEEIAKRSSGNRIESVNTFRKMSSTV
jgi:hypothetical protein